jgi:hypothetical protein
MCFSYEREVLVRQAQHEDRLRRARQRAFKRANHLPYSRFNAFNQQLTHWLGRQLAVGHLGRALTALRFRGQYGLDVPSRNAIVPTLNQSTRSSVTDGRVTHHPNNVL